MVQWVVRSILHVGGVDPLSYFLFQPVLHNWCNKGHGMYYPVFLIFILQILQSHDTKIPEVSDVGEDHQDVLDAIDKVTDVDHQETVYI